MMENIVILGGGVGGLVAANRLRATLPKTCRVVLVDRESQFVFAPSMLWLLTGDRTAEKITRPLAVLERKGIEVVHGEVQRIDPVAREITVGGSQLKADVLIVALGAEMDAHAIPGLAEAGHNFYDLAGTVALAEALKSFDGGKIIVLTATSLYKSPAAPYEAAMRLCCYCRKRGLGPRAQVHFYAAEQIPMPASGSEASRGVLQVLVWKGIAYHPGCQIVSVDPALRRLHFANGAEETFDLLAYVPPHLAPRVVREAGLTDESGWVPVDRHTLETKFPGVYALGDITGIPLKCGKALPKAGVFAHRQAEVVARNIARAMTGKGSPAAFDGDGAFFLETGNGMAAFGKGNYYAEPEPQIKLQSPGRHWHAAKVIFEKDWFRRWF